MGMIREETLRRLIRIVEESEIDELEISRWGTRVKITRRRARESSNGTADATAVVTAAPAPERVAPPAAEAGALPEKAEGHVVVKSPMVGTFYAAAAPGEPPFVNVGDRVNAGQVVCIIEAMKLMNEIHAEVAGRVVSVTATNGKPVEYGQGLFVIDPKG
jgi:acetyl-CoA carboxylase biotin carboxyl carrier protein